MADGRDTPVIDGGERAADLPRGQREDGGNGKADHCMRQWEPPVHLEQHQRAACSDQQIWLHVETSLNANEQRLEMQVCKVVENDHIHQPGRAKKAGKVWRGELLGSSRC